MRTAPAVVLPALLLAVAACGQSDQPSPPKAMTGTCAADHSAHPSLRPLSTTLVNAALGPGRVKVDGTIRTDGAGVPDTGTCTFFLAASPTEHQVMVGVNQKTDLFTSTAQARTVASTDPGADTLIWVSVLTPEKAGAGTHGDDAVTGLKRAVKELTRPL